jgi:phosphoribosylaminoimidazolecarboxamide formyltransferase/IMP cyclohydrolase
MLKIKTAVISVSDKGGIVEFAKFLAESGVEIISTGGTGKLLRENGIAVTPIREITGNKKDDYFDGRMKTISFNYESALLYKRDNPKHVEQARGLGIPRIDMVVCNLYPFEQVTAKEGVTVDTAVENIDIGGPCMIRAAAKNYRSIATVVNPDRYGRIMNEMKKNDGALGEDILEELIIEAYERTADYDAAIHTFFARSLKEQRVKRLKYVRGEQLGRYAENWHQKGWLYHDPASGEPSAPGARQIHGGPMGYNNYVDAEAALNSMLELHGTTAVSIIKHTNPCGYATGATLREAFERAWQGDPVSSFGSVIAVTRPFDLDCAKFIENKFVEVILAPSFEKNALEFIQGLGKKKAGLRLLEYGEARPLDPRKHNIRGVTGGLLEQERDTRFYLCDSFAELVKPAAEHTCANSGKKLKVGVVTKGAPPAERAGLYDFVLRHVKHVKSNTICIAREYEPGKYQILGMGCGQPNRKDSVMLSGMRARDNLALEAKAKGVNNVEEYINTEMAGDHVVLASDAFFPFRDGLDNAAKTGVKYVLEPGGSIKDTEVIAAAEEHGVCLMFTGVRKFTH